MSERQVKLMKLFFKDSLFIKFLIYTLIFSMCNYYIPSVSYLFNIKLVSEVLAQEEEIEIEDETSIINALPEVETEIPPLIQKEEGEVAPEKTEPSSDESLQKPPEVIKEESVPTIELAPEKALPSPEAQLSLPSLYILDISASGIPAFEVAQISSLVKEEVKNLNKYHIVEGEELNARILQKWNAVRDIKSRETEKLIEEGKTSFQNMDIDQTIQKLEKAKSNIESEDVLKDATFDYSQIYLYLGFAYIAKGKEDLARRELLKFFTINPDYNLSSEGLSENMTTFFNKIKQESNKSPKGVVSIISDPPFANIYIDGNLRGVTPITIDNITLGEHYLKVELEGYKTIYSKVNIDSPELKSLGFTIVKNDGQEIFDKYISSIVESQNQEQKMEDIISLGNFLKLNYIMSGTIDRPAIPIDRATPIGDTLPSSYILNLSMIDIANKSLVRSVGVEIKSNLSDAENLEEARKKVKYIMPFFAIGEDVSGLLKPIENSMKAKKLPFDPIKLPLISDSLMGTSEVKSKKAVKSSAEIYKKWWLWTMVGVVAAGATTGILVATKGGGGGVNENAADLTITLK